MKINEFTSRMHSIKVLKTEKEKLENEYRALLLLDKDLTTKKRIHELEIQLNNLSFAIKELEEIFLSKTFINQHISTAGVKTTRNFSI